MIEFIALFMGISIWLYCLLGGADFGAGILELFTPEAVQKEQRKVVNKALSSVWEVNHIWLILALVICFNAFPKAWSQIAITFHIPLTIMLVGIVCRGCAFTFRHYDAYKDESQIYYNRFFTLSSLLTPFSLGLVAGGLILGRINPWATSFDTAYIAPWFNLFSFTLAIFLCILFTYLASIYMVGETSDQKLKSFFIFRAKRWMTASIAGGGAVFITGWFSHSDLFQRFLTSPVSLFCVGLTTLLLIPAWIALNERAVWIPRIIASGQFTLIVLGWYNVEYPYLIPPSPQFGYPGLTLYDAAASGAVLNSLAFALVIGSILIFPSIFYLFKVFKVRA